MFNVPTTQPTSSTSHQTELNSVLHLYQHSIGYLGVSDQDHGLP